MSEGKTTVRLELADALRLADPGEISMVKDMSMHHYPGGGWKPEDGREWALLQKLGRRRLAELTTEDGGE